MDMSDAGLTPLFIEEFRLCSVSPGESAVILTEAGSRTQYVLAAQTALAALGARAVHVNLPSRPTAPADVPSVTRGTASVLLDDFPEVTDLLTKVNFIVDLTLGGLIHSRQRAEIRKSGARTLLIKEPPDALARLIPTAERTRKIDAAVARLKRASEMLVTSRAGTDFRADLKGSTVQGAYGFCDKPGSSATWATNAVLAYPVSTQVNGEVVLAPGDIVYPFYRYVEGTVRLRFRDGFVESVEGGGIDAELIREYFAQWNERNAYGISHVGWGLHEKALWNALSFYRADEASGVDGRSFEGNFLISTGPNHAANRHSRCHFDIPMRNCTIVLDGETVVKEGRLAAA